ncbi:hypothetical protein SASPL_146849 [Salvia splendens]|uniref:Uncharacterized protein n=1 Tax=Salvia splendens TaxID=180675 RepID=A0A8X8WCM1_SALSN|nr:uncharacterized protein LOC121776453 [Salvia splendens]KAG6392625.1 hypothetical protein SASPL_146849 [Salvia splendens]
MGDCCEDPMTMCRVVCPKPRRVAPLNLNTISRFHIRNDSESNHGADLLGLILRQDYNEAERCGYLASSPPFSFGSPPTRTQNPVVQDADFWVEKLTFDSSSEEQFTNLGKKQAANRSRLQGF